MVSTRDAPAESANAVVDRAAHKQTKVDEAHHPGRKQPDKKQPDASPSPASSADPAPSPPDQPFCSPLLPLTRLATVRRDTVVALLLDGEPIRLRRPGELLIPRWNPFDRPVQVLAINTAPVELLVTVPDLGTVDDETIEAVDVQLSVQLLHAPGELAIPALIRDFGADCGAELMRQVLHTVDGSVRGAVHTHRLEELRRRSLPSVLTDRWLPVSFASGRLTRLAFSVPRVIWPGDQDTSEQSTSPGVDSERRP